MRHLYPSALSALLLAAATTANAGGLVDVSVVDRDTGQTLPLYHHAGRAYVAGVPGARYAVRVANTSDGRILAVVAVDGVNAVTGETAAPDQSGYVLEPGQRYEVKGWRKSVSEVAAFYFTALPDSYAARTDRPDDVGVIGVAVFRERVPPPPARDVAPRPESRELPQPGRPSAADEAAGAASGAGAPVERAAPVLREKLGTGHGDRESSRVVHTVFERASARPEQLVRIYYDRYENLVARGIIVAPRPEPEPDPFPGGHFVPDPRD